MIHRQAVCDYRFLLNRGYSRSSALRVVTERYRLRAEQRNLLLRSVFSEEECRRRRRVKLSAADVAGERLLVDGYNLLITVECWKLGMPVLRCDDGFLRDFRGVYGKYRAQPCLTRSALESIFSTLRRLEPESVLMVFDSMVSRSGELCSWINRLETGLRLVAETARSPDAVLRSEQGVACTGDTAVIDGCSAVLDLAAEVIPHAYPLSMPECKGLY
ncbi:MAG: DUF434 domain-containing protein [Euryarchaeota archaeon]|nr:DUF434 domain-containing protein [Euryarchaeota archaeon]